MTLIEPRVCNDNFTFIRPPVLFLLVLPATELLSFFDTSAEPILGIGVSSGLRASSLRF